MKINLRPVCESDEPFLFELYAGTREAEMAVVPWPKEQKLAFLESQFRAQKVAYAASHPGADHYLIYADREPVGRLYMSRLPDRLHILDVTIAQSKRKEGIGSAVLEDILREAEESGKAVTIYVEDFNPSSRLFERLGFRPAEAIGFHVLLRWRASAA